MTTKFWFDLGSICLDGTGGSTSHWLVGLSVICSGISAWSFIAVLSSQDDFLLILTDQLFFLVLFIVCVETAKGQFSSSTTCVGAGDWTLVTWAWWTEVLLPAEPPAGSDQCLHHPTCHCLLLPLPVLLWVWFLPISALWLALQVLSFVRALEKCGSHRGKQRIRAERQSLLLRLQWLPLLVVPALCSSPRWLWAPCLWGRPRDAILPSSCSCDCFPFLKPLWLFPSLYFPPWNHLVVDFIDSKTLVLW